MESFEDNSPIPIKSPCVDAATPVWFVGGLLAVIVQMYVQVDPYWQILLGKWDSICHAHMAPIPTPFQARSVPSPPSPTSRQLHPSLLPPFPCQVLVLPAPMHGVPYTGASRAPHALPNRAINSYIVTKCFTMLL